MLKFKLGHAQIVIPTKPQAAWKRITWNGLYGQDSAIYPADMVDSTIHYLTKHTDAQIVSVTAVL